MTGTDTHKGIVLTGCGCDHCTSSTTATDYYPVYNGYYEKEEYDEDYYEDEWWLFNWQINFLIKILLMTFLTEARCRSPTVQGVIVSI